MYSIQVIVVIIGLFHAYFCEKTLPVFILDNEKVLAHKHIDNDPLATISTKQFSEIIKNSVDHSEITLFFIEESFCREDHSIKDDEGTPYYHLREGILDDRVKYLPSVTTPYTTITNIFHPQPFNVFYVSSTDYKPQIHINTLKYYYFYFKEENDNEMNETRSEVLRKHDFIINETYSMISEQGKKPIIAFYTGKVNPIQLDIPISPRRLRRPVEGVLVQAPRAVFYFRGVTNSDFRRSIDTDLLEVPIVIKEEAKENTLRTTMSYPEFQLSFNFVLDPWYWTLGQYIDIFFIYQGLH